MYICGLVIHVPEEKPGPVSPGRGGGKTARAIRARRLIG